MNESQNVPPDLMNEYISKLEATLAAVATKMHIEQGLAKQQHSL